MLLLLTMMNLSSAAFLPEKEKIEIFETLLTNYNSNIRAQVGKQLNVTVNFHIETLSDIDQSRMEYEMTVFFRICSKIKDFIKY